MNVDTIALTIQERVVFSMEKVKRRQKEKKKKEKKRGEGLLPFNNNKNYHLL